MHQTGAQIVIDCLLEQGVDTVFGFPGGAILNLYDELYLHRDEIRHVLTSHEQGAAHAADGYARATGKVGVCLATSGPGATNLVTGIATAYMDSVPLVAITCNVTLPLLGKDSFQEIDIAGITMPITKHNFIVKDVKDLAVTIRRAFSIARSGRPGPVLVDIPKDVTAAKTDYIRIEPSLPAPKTALLTDEALTHAVSMIKRSRRPVIFVGGGAVSSGASEEVRRFAEMVDAPVCDSLMGKGAYSGQDSDYIGMLGMHGTKAANFAVSKCDLLIALGTRFSDRVLGNPKTFAKEAKILQFDIDPAEINKNVTANACVIGDLKEALSRLIPLLAPQAHPAWKEEVEALAKDYPLAIPEGLSGPFLVDEIYRQTKGDGLIVTEVGQHQMWAAQFYRYSRPRQLLTSGGLGTMGFGLGASIGAAMGCPGKKVINIAGDGCFRMNMIELMTAVRWQLPIIEVVVNNHVLGMVRQWQDLFYEKRFSHTVLDDGADFCAIAEGMGATAFCADTRESFAEAFSAAMACEGPVLIDARIDCDDKVWPMVAPGASISEAFDASDLAQRKAP